MRFRVGKLVGAIVERATLTGDVYRVAWNGWVVPKTDMLFGVVVEQNAKGHAYVPAGRRVAWLGYGDAEIFFTGSHKNGALHADGNRTFRPRFLWG